MKEPSWHRRETFDRVDGTSMIVHRSKDNPARLNPPPSPAIVPRTHSSPHVCHFISFHVRAYAKTFFDKRARITKRAALSPPHPTLPVTFHRAGAALDECRTGSWSARKARASSNPLVLLSGSRVATLRVEEMLRRGCFANWRAR